MGVYVLTRSAAVDQRGMLLRIFDSEELQVFGMESHVCQTNLVRTHQSGTIRGMHLQQHPSEEQKIVTCIQGSIFDVALDTRLHSPTYGEWFALNLSADAEQSLVIPKGVAHGVQSLEPNCAVLYTHSASYDKFNEIGVNPFDSEVAISWPLEVSEISARDSSLPPLSELKGIS
jgi:dTDP-4-dehydrorhamnose 3,5-epimerase